jgi:hypothetical protein
MDIYEIIRNDDITSFKYTERLKKHNTMQV